jgi:hypothetical protein
MGCCISRQRAAAPPRLPSASDSPRFAGDSVERGKFCTAPRRVGDAMPPHPRGPRRTAWSEKKYVDHSAPAVLQRRFRERPHTLRGPSGRRYHPPGRWHSLPNGRARCDHCLCDCVIVVQTGVTPPGRCPSRAGSPAAAHVTLRRTDRDGSLPAESRSSCAGEQSEHGQGQPEQGPQFPHKTHHVLSSSATVHDRLNTPPALASSPSTGRASQKRVCSFRTRRIMSSPPPRRLTPG